MDETSEKITRLLADPGVISLIGSIAKGIRENPTPQEKNISSENAGQKERIKLLLALKPFLCPEKREKVDGIISILNMLSFLDKNEKLL